jgi:hypothetical protein
MRLRHLFVVFIALTFMTAGQTSGDEKTAKTLKVVQASPDRPDSTRKSSVRGLVTDKSGKAVGKARVELTDPVTKEPPVSVITDKKGRYVFGGLLPGAYNIQAKKGEMQSDLTEIKVSNGSNVGPELTLLPRSM